MTILKWAGYFLLFFLAFGVALVSMRYWSFQPMDFLLMKPAEQLADQLFLFSFYGHVIFGPLALMSGPFQFLPKFRARNLKAHRLVGKIYVLSCLLSGAGRTGCCAMDAGRQFHQIGLFVASRQLVVYHYQSLFGHPPKKGGRTPPMDVAQLCPDPCGSGLAAAFTDIARLAGNGFYRGLSNSGLVMLDTEFVGGGVVDKEARIN